LLALGIYCHQMGNSVTQGFYMCFVGTIVNLALMVIRYRDLNIIFEMLLTLSIPLVAVIGLLVLELIPNHKKSREKPVEAVVTTESKLQEKEEDLQITLQREFI
jgi:hypothetical protein